jgi:hypothetical protein
MDGGLVRVLMWPVGLGAAGAALCCWGLALGGYWPVAFALGGPRALPAAGAVLALGVVLAAGGGGLLAAALVVAVRGERVRTEHAARRGRSEAGEASGR